MQAKLAQILFIRHIAEREAGAATPVSALAAHPGVVASALAPDLPPLIRRSAGALAISPDTAAEALTRLALDQPATEAAGYFSYHTFTRRMPDHPARLARRARQPRAAADVWRLTLAQLVAGTTQSGRMAPFLGYTAN